MVYLRRAALALMVVAPALVEQVQAGEGLVRASHWDATSFAGQQPGASRAIARRQIEAFYTRERGSHSQRLRYVHDALLIRSGDPLSNGYLHQLDAGFGWRPDDLELNLDVGVHASSNMFKHGRWHPDALTVTFSAWHELPARAFSAGIGGDYRFGRFLVYPRLRLPVELGGSTLHIDLPVGVTWATADGRWRLEVQRHGEKWATLDSSRRHHGKLYLSEWRLAGTLSLATGLKASRLEMGAGISLGSRVSYLDLSAGRRSERLENRLFGQLAVRW